MSERPIPAFSVARGDYFPVMRVEEEGTPDDLAIPVGELEPVRAPTQVGAHHHDLAVRFGATPWHRATIEMLYPDRSVSSTMRSCFRISPSLPA